MSKLTAVSTILCTFAGVILLPSSGCSPSTSDPIGDIESAQSASDADAGPPQKKGDLVISQVYWHGGFAAAPGRNDDYVELFNRSRMATVPLKGLSLQIATPAGTFGSEASEIIPLSADADKSVAPG